jgi:hypothetical protein
MNFIIIFILSAILQLIAPWWVIALIPFLINVWRPTSPLLAFFTSFAAIAALWFGYGLYLHVNSEGIMSNRIAEIFSLPNGILLLIITAVIGGIVGGFSGLSGFFVQQIFDNKPPASTRKA